MTPFNPKRRDLLRVGSLGVAGAAIPSVSFAAAASGESTAPNTAPAPTIFSVRQYGATGDGKTLDTAAVNRAIDAAAAAGGGLVLFPPGTYLCFSIHLKSNVHLHLEEGATILAAESPRPGETTGYNGGVYDAAEPNAPWEPYQDYGHNHWHNSLLWGEDLHDISITGAGLIYGKGLSFGAESHRARRLSHLHRRAARRRQQSHRPQELPQRPPARLLHPQGRPLRACCSPASTTSPSTTSRIDTDRDGIDIDCCQNVRVSNCTVNSPWDDGICPKSSYALGYARAHAQRHHRQLLRHRLLSSSAPSSTAP